MASVPENVLIFWPSNDSVPTGWAHDSDFDNKFIYINSTGGSNAGSDNHNHSGNSHSHPGGSHSHGSNVTGAQHPCWKSNYASGMGNPNANGGGDEHHTHNLSIGSASTSGSSGGTGNFNAGGNIPSYYHLRVIRSTGDGDGFPSGSLVLWAANSNPTDWSQHSATAGYYVRGTSGSIGTSSGSGSHGHPGGSHNHGGGGGSHPHSVNISGMATKHNYTGTGADQNWRTFHLNHAHSGGNAGSTGGSGANSGNVGSAGGATFNPKSYYLRGITTGSNAWLEGAICMIEGSVPDDWSQNSSYNGYLLSFATSGGNVSVKSSSNSHNHPSPGSHGHPGNAHTHPSTSPCLSGFYYQEVSDGENHGIDCDDSHPTTSGHNTNRFYCPSVPYGPAGPGGQNKYVHKHTMGNTNSGSHSFNSGTGGVQSKSEIPAYRTVRLITAPEEPAGAGGNVGMFGANF